MKKRLYGAFLLLLIGCSMIVLQQQYAAETTEAVMQKGSARTLLTISRDEVYKGDLLLVNSHYPVPNDVDVSNVVNLFENPNLVQGFGILDRNVELPLDTLHRFYDMIESARADGVSHFLINSGYRDKKKQAELYKQLGSDYANPPGFSEHNLGLSMDIGSTLGMMKNAPEGKWLKKNAWKHGFVMRYPEDKTDITGIMYEPWHFRYVGLPHSAIMLEHGFVLEEYLTYLKEQKSIHIEVEGKEYNISYYPINGDTKLSVPLHESYAISGNNTEGVIVTTWKADPSDAKEAGKP